MKFTKTIQPIYVGEKKKFCEIGNLLLIEKKNSNQVCCSTLRPIQM